MSISIMGSVASYTKTMKLQTQWELKQRSGDYTSHKKSLQDWLESSQEKLNQTQSGASTNSEEERKKLSDILQKVYAGKKLTESERRYLKSKDPQSYEKLRSTEREQKAYEQKLRQCKTKEEVQRLKMTNLASSLTIVNAVSNNPRIPLTKKLEICAQEKVRCDRMQESTNAFIRSGEYNRLPTEAEENKALKEENEKLHKPVKPGQTTVEKVEPAEPQPGQEQTPEVEQTNQAEQTGQTTQADSASKTGQTTKPGKTVVKIKATAHSEKSSSAHVSPELRKVRRARRQAASAAYNAMSTAGSAPSLPTFNVKA